jgi:hypothetical protein
MASQWCPEARKQKYKRKSLALNAMIKVQLQRLYDGKQMSIYQCLGCGGWHYGHTPGMSDIVRLPRKST